MHTGAWDESVDLTGKRVGVVGSAASAVQSIPEIAKVAGKLTVFQRSANWVLPKEDVEHTDEQLAQFLNPEELQAYHDGIMTFLVPSVPFSNPDINGAAEWVAACAIEVVEDPETRRKLTPDTPWGCLRPLFSNHYYPTFNRPNVELTTEAIERITPTGIVTADGTEHELDVIVFATGYEVDKFASRIPIYGRGGQSLRDAWADGAKAYLGCTTTGFPNLFMLYGPNTNVGSLIPVIESEAHYAVKTIEAMDAAGIDWVDVKREVMDAYNETLDEAVEAVEVWHGGCSHYYLADSGRNVTQYPWSMETFYANVETPNLDDFERRQSASTPDTASAVGPGSASGRSLSDPTRARSGSGGLWAADDSCARNEPSSAMVLISGAGNTTVEFLSTAISISVWRFRSWSARGCAIITSEASPSDAAAMASPSAAMIFARFSRSASASLAIARFIPSGSWMSFSSTSVTSTPHSAAVSSRIARMSTFSRSVSARVSSRVCLPTTLRNVVWAIWLIAALTSSMATIDFTGSITL